MYSMAMMNYAGNAPHKVLLVAGTRPEAIKLAPLVVAMRSAPQTWLPSFCVSGQHKEMIDHVLGCFDLVPDHRLDVMSANQSLAAVTARLLEGLTDFIAKAQPNIIISQGDTTTAFAASLAGFYSRTPVGHVEAGLRTGDLMSPFPEEGNRILIDHIATLLFAPTERNRERLVAEGIDSKRIFVTGNTGIDALLVARDRVPKPIPTAWSSYWAGADAKLRGDDQIVLVTLHRRESFGETLIGILTTIRRVAEAHQETMFIYPVHLNPNVNMPAHSILGGLPNVLLIPPVPYLAFVFLMDRADLILTDSGGIQEEAPSLGTKVIVLRDVSERQEAVESGAIRLGGTEPNKLYEIITETLKRDGKSSTKRTMVNPFGDGTACRRILEVTEQQMKQWQKL